MTKEPKPAHSTRTMDLRQFIGHSIQEINGKLAMGGYYLPPEVVAMLNIPSYVGHKGKIAIEMFMMAIATKVHAILGPWAKFLPVKAWYYFLSCQSRFGTVLRPTTVCLMLWPNGLMTRGLALCSNGDLNKLTRNVGRKEAFRRAWLAKDQPQANSFPIKDRPEISIAMSALTHATEAWSYSDTETWFKGQRFMPGNGNLTTYEQSLIKSYKDHEDQPPKKVELDRGPLTITAGCACGCGAKLGDDDFQAGIKPVCSCSNCSDHDSLSDINNTKED